jgi:hypothetical protein
MDLKNLIAVKANSYQHESVSFRIFFFEVISRTPVFVPLHHHGWPSIHMVRSTEEYGDVGVPEPVPNVDFSIEALHTCEPTSKTPEETLHLSQSNIG